MGLFDRRPSPALVRVAVNVTLEPATTLVGVAASVVRVGTSRQVLYGVVHAATSYCCWSVATSQRPNEWAFQPARGFVRE